MAVNYGIRDTAEYSLCSVGVQGLTCIEQLASRDLEIGQDTVRLPTSQSLCWPSVDRILWAADYLELSP